MGADRQQPESGAEDDSGAAEEVVTSGADASEEEVSEQERLAGEVALLEAENEQLRTEYARLQQTQYRQTAIALVGVGLVAALGGLLLPSARTVLLALGGTGVFLGVLTYYLSPERFLSASVGRAVYETAASNQAGIVAELGLSETRLYVPVGEADVRLYVPASPSEPLPDDDDALGERFVVTEQARGVAFEPSGQALLADVEQALTDDLGSEPAAVARQLREALVEQFELVDSAEQSVPDESDREAGELTVGVEGSAYGPLERFDHPVASVLAVGLARALNAPVAVTVDPDGNDRVDATVTCRWPEQHSREEEER